MKRKRGESSSRPINVISQEELLRVLPNDLLRIVFSYLRLLPRHVRALTPSSFEHLKQTDTSHCTITLDAKPCYLGGVERQEGRTVGYDKADSRVMCVRCRQNGQMYKEWERKTAGEVHLGSTKDVVFIISQGVAWSHDLDTGIYALSHSIHGISVFAARNDNKIAWVEKERPQELNLAQWPHVRFIEVMHVPASKWTFMTFIHGRLVLHSPRMFLVIDVDKEESIARVSENAEVIFSDGDLI